MKISGPVSVCQLRVHADETFIDYEIFADFHGSAENYCEQCKDPTCPEDIVAYIEKEIANAEQTDGASFLHILYEGTQAGCPTFDESEPPTEPLDRVEAIFCGRKGKNYHVQDIDIRKEGILGALENNTKIVPFIEELANMNHSWTQILSIFLACHLDADDYQQCFRKKLPTVPFTAKVVNEDVIDLRGSSRIRHHTQLLNSATQRRIRTQWRNDISRQYLLNGMYLSKCTDDGTDTTFEEDACFINPEKKTYDLFMLIIGSVLMEWYTIIVSLSTIDTNGKPMKQNKLPRNKKVIIYVGEAHQFHIMQFLKRLYPSSADMTIIQDSPSYYKHTGMSSDSRNRCISKIDIPRAEARSKKTRRDDDDFGTYNHYECIDSKCIPRSDGPFKSLEQCQKKCHSDIIYSNYRKGTKNSNQKNG